MSDIADELSECCARLHLTFGDRWGLYAWGDILLERNLLNRVESECRWKTADWDKLFAIRDSLRSEGARESLRAFLACCPAEAVWYCDRKRSAEGIDVERMWLHIGLYFDQILARGEVARREGKREATEGSLW
jgi:hypothetical protein